MSRSRRRDTRIGGAPKTFIFAPRMTRTELITSLVRRRRRELINQGVIADPALRAPRFTFFWKYGEESGEIHADDRSTARSMIKKVLGISKNKRLPTEVEIVRESYTQNEIA